MDSRYLVEALNSMGQGAPQAPAQPDVMAMSKQHDQLQARKASGQKSGLGLLGDKLGGIPGIEFGGLGALAAHLFKKG